MRSESNPNRLNLQGFAGTWKDPSGTVEASFESPSEVAASSLGLVDELVGRGRLDRRTWALLDLGNPSVRAVGVVVAAGVAATVAFAPSVAFVPSVASVLVAAEQR